MFILKYLYKNYKKARRVANILMQNTGRSVKKHYVHKNIDNIHDKKNNTA